MIMSDRDIYRSPAVRWGYNPKDEPIGATAELYTKRGPVRVRGKGLDDYVAERRRDDR